MSIITITDAVFGCGETLAQRVSALLGYRYVSEKELIKALQLSTPREAILSDVLEIEPPWWKRLRENHRHYRVALQAAMCDIAEGGNFVYHGRTGQALIPSIRHVLKVMLIVPIEYRIEQVTQAKGFGKEAASLWLTKMDDVTDQRVKAIFGVGWRDPTRYDFVLNLSRLTVELEVSLIVKAIEQVEYQPIGESEMELRNYIVETKVRAALLASAHTSHIAVKVQANSGLVHLSALLNPISYDFKDEIIRIAEGVSGVRKVTADIRLLPADDGFFGTGRITGFPI